ncbi:winged helix-turn-helix domain-containing protein [Pelagibacteraceae bacterium]|nr:winged helix-turn-helix domain-containing protein [Pelagibacteraceae bacterium]
MHQLKVLIFGPSSFIATLDELKPFLKFNSVFDDLNKDHDVILFHEDALNQKEQKDIINSSNSIKICASSKKKSSNTFDICIELPATLKEINTALENIIAKKRFNKNSSIKIKNYLLNKNEKKLFKSNDFIILTEKEVQLLELFLENKKPISKDNILAYVWKYSLETDTHTVETHIYRLRKKIIDKFMDKKFILNNKDGYYL